MIKAKVVAVEGERVKVELEDGQILVVPTASVEGVTKEGMEVGLVVVALGSEDAGKQAIARHLLNNLLGE